MPCVLTQSCLTLCDPMDCSLPGSSVRGILQAGILERVAMPSSRRSSNPGIKPVSPASPVLQGIFFTTKPLGRGVPGIHYCTADVGVRATHNFPLTGLGSYADLTRLQSDGGWAGVSQRLCRDTPRPGLLSPFVPEQLLSTQPLHIASSARWLPKAHMPGLPLGPKLEQHPFYCGFLVQVIGPAQLE